MINGFATYTEPLTQYEKDLIPLIVKGFACHKGKDKVISSKEIVRKLKEKGYEVSGPRIRKIVNHIRANSIAPIVANAKGYWWSTSLQEIKDHIKSLRDRSGGIISAANGLLNYVENRNQQGSLL